MSQGIITNAGRAFLANKQSLGQPAIIDRFVLANVAGQDHTTPADPNSALPTPGSQVGTFSVSASGYVTPDAVVYSLYLGADIGDFVYNWVGLLADDDTLVAFRKVAPISKFSTVGDSLGNAVTRNFLIAYTNVQSITNLNVLAESWQLNFEPANNLTTNDPNRPLSAAMGVAIANAISAITLASLGAASASHNHDGVYSPAGHNHDSDYSPAGHNHDSAYSPLAHHHNGVYSPVSHNHDSAYSPLAHNHSGIYSPAGHRHDSDYSPLAHNHNGVYSPVSHAHDATYVKISDVVNNLTSTETQKPLSAAQGKAAIDALNAHKKDPIPAYSPSTSYAKGAVVTGALNHIYRSRVDNNLGQNPNLSSNHGNWDPVYYPMVKSKTSSLTTDISGGRAFVSGLTFHTEDQSRYFIKVQGRVRLDEGLTLTTGESVSILISRAGAAFNDFSIDEGQYMRENFDGAGGKDWGFILPATNSDTGFIIPVIERVSVDIGHTELAKFSYEGYFSSSYEGQISIGFEGDKNVRTNFLSAQVTRLHT